MNSTTFNLEQNNPTTSQHQPPQNQSKQHQPTQNQHHHIPVETLVVYFLIIALFLGMLCR